MSDATELARRVLDEAKHLAPPDPDNMTDFDDAATLAQAVLKADLVIKAAAEWDAKQAERITELEALVEERGDLLYHQLRVKRDRYRETLERIERGEGYAHGDCVCDDIAREVLEEEEN